MIFKKKRYKFYVIEMCESHINRKIQEAYSDGWELHGEMSTFQHNRTTYCVQPMKKRIK